MAIINCNECYENISNEANACPHCGAPTKHGKKKERASRRGNRQGIGCLLIILAFILSLTVVGTPFGVLIGLAGLIILVIGLFS